MQTPPYGLFPAMAGTKALPQGKSKELIVIPQAVISGQQKQVSAKTARKGFWSLTGF